MGVALALSEGLGAVIIPLFPVLLPAPGFDWMAGDVPCEDGFAFSAILGAGVALRASVPGEPGDFTDTRHSDLPFVPTCYSGEATLNYTS